MAWGSGGRGFPAAVRRQILERDPLCSLHLDGCSGASTEADHIKPRHLGGSDDPGNGRGVCSWCHKQVTQRQSAAARARSVAKTKRPAVKHPGLL